MTKSNPKEYWQGTPLFVLWYGLMVYTQVTVFYEIYGIQPEGWAYITVVVVNMLTVLLVLLASHSLED